MKLIILTAFLFGMLNQKSYASIPLTALTDTCFKAIEQTPSSVASVLCFEDSQIDFSRNKLLFLGTESNMPAELEINSLIRINEDFYSFVAKKNLVNKWESGCGEGLNVTLVVKGNADYTGYVGPKELSLSLLVEYLADTCHSTPQKSQVDYILSR